MGHQCLISVFGANLLKKGNAWNGSNDYNGVAEQGQEVHQIRGKRTYMAQEYTTKECVPFSIFLNPRASSSSSSNSFILEY